MKWVRGALVAAVALLAWILIAPLISRALIVERRLEKADAIVVLSGSSVYKERCGRAAELYREGAAPIVYLSDDGLRAGWSRAENRNPFFAELAQRELIAGGVPPDSIRILDGIVAGTDDEARAITTESRKQDFSSVLLVTSPYHSRRAYFAFSTRLAAAGVTVGAAHTPVGDLSPGYEYWWTTPRSIRDVASEYVKLAGYWAFSYAE